MSRLVGRLGHWVAGITFVSCLAFVGLPFIAAGHLGAAPFLALTVIWAITSSALRAPPLMLLGKYAARPAIPYLGSLAMLGLGIASAVSPYLAITLAKQDPRLPFVIASVTLLLVSLALAKVERSLAKQAPATNEPPQTVDRAVPRPVMIFGARGRHLRAWLPAPRVLQQRPAVQEVHQQYRHAAAGVLGRLFGRACSRRACITKRWGGLPVMGLAGLLGAIAIVLMESSTVLGLTVAAQLIAGAAWGAILMSAFAAAAALG